MAGLSDEELAERVGAPRAFAPALRGARDLEEARATARSLAERPSTRVSTDGEPTLARFTELRGASPERLNADAARSLIRELKAVGGDLRALRLALTGRERGPALWSVLVALEREEAVHRAEAALD